ncbi:MAG TPA: ABC transporter permease [Candidatus Acidoferrales bacterium]|nr:ABC transporter permease [Candidatus Acidoferrales bacterium]
MRTSIEQLAQDLLYDLRYAVRMIGKNPAFTLLAALSLALGIGANTAIYSFMDAILMRALPVQHPEALALVQYHTKDFPAIAHGFSGSNFRDPNRGLVSGNIPFPAYEALRASNTVFSGMFGFTNAGRQLTMLVRGEGAVAQAEYVTGEFFPSMGVRGAAGRLLDATDDRLGGAPVAVVSYHYATRRFGEIGKAVGQPVLLNNVPFTIVGVTEPEFLGMYPGTATDLYLPMRSNAALEARPGFDTNARYIDKNNYWVQVIGRLRPGVTLAQAQAALAPVFDGFIRGTASNDKERADLPQFYLQEAAGGMDFLRRRYAKPLYVLMTMVGLILAIACANIANLLLARAAGRRREMAVRLSLGAGRARVIRQLLTESLLLALIGGVLGIYVGQWGIRILSVLIANGQETFVLNASLNWHVLAVTIAAALGTGLLFGLAPALQASGVDLTPALKQARGGETLGRTGAGGTGTAHLRGWFRAGLSRVLVVSQIAISLLLLVAAGLFVRSLSNLHAIATGFNQDRLLLFSVNAWQAGYRDTALTRFYETLHERLAAVPGVRSATLSDIALLSGSASSNDIHVPGVPPEVKRDAYMLTVGPSYFDTMQIPILLGRDFSVRDMDARRVLVNELFAKTNFGNDNPMGRHFSTGRGQFARDYEIAGVVKNVRYASLKRDIPPTVYRPCCDGVRGITYAVRTAGDPLSAAASARELVRQADSRIPITNVTTQERVIEQGVGQERTFATLCTGFALLAMAIAGVGLYGTMAYNVSRRTGEIGIRMALGAQRGRVVWMVQREVLVLAAAGLAIGIPVAYSAATLVETFLFGIKARDAITLTVASALLLVAAIAAGYGPARRASRIDPMMALRDD